MKATLMWIAKLAALVAATPPADKCVCMPGQACWPSTDTWSAFNGTVGGGRLQVIHPVGRACHDPNFDNATCQFVIEQYGNSSWTADQIGMSSLQCS